MTYKYYKYIYLYIYIYIYILNEEGENRILGFDFDSLVYLKYFWKESHFILMRDCHVTH